MGVKNVSSCMKMAASLIAITCVLLGITPANSQEKTYDYGMDPTIVKNPADNDLPRAQGPFHKIPKLGSLLTRQLPRAARDQPHVSCWSQSPAYSHH